MSTDQSIKLAENYLKIAGVDYSIIEASDKQGAGYARNFGMLYLSRLVHSEDLVFFIDADDTWCAHHIQTHQRLAQNYSGSGIFSSGYIIDGIQVDRNLTKHEHNLTTDFAKYYFFNRGLICSSSFSCRGRTLLKGFHFSERIVGEDIITWLESIPKFGLAFSPSITNIIYPDLSQNGSFFIIKKKPSIAFFMIDRENFWENVILARRHILISIKYKYIKSKMLRPLHIIISSIFLELGRRVVLFLSIRKKNNGQIKND